MGDAETQIRLLQLGYQGKLFNKLSLFAIHGSAIFPWAHPCTEWRLVSTDDTELASVPRFLIFIHPDIRVMTGIFAVCPDFVLVEVWNGPCKMFEESSDATEAGVIGILSTAAAVAKKLIADKPEKFRCWMAERTFHMPLHDQPEHVIEILPGELIWTNPMNSGIFRANQKKWLHPAGPIGDFQASFRCSFSDKLEEPWSTSDWSPMEK